MIKITVEPKPEDVAYINAILSGIKNGYPRAVSGAINDVLAEGRTKITREVRAEINIKLSSLRKRIRITKATPQRLSGAIRLKERGRPNLVSFGARQKGSGIVFKIGKSGKQEFIHGGFINKSKNALIAMRRVGKERYPLEVLVGPSITEFVQQKRIDDATKRLMQTKLPERIRARANLLFERTGR